MSVFKLVSLDSIREQLVSPNEHHHHHAHRSHHSHHKEEAEDLQLQNLAKWVPMKGYDPFCEIDNTCDPQYRPKRHSEDYEPIPEEERRPRNVDLKELEEGSKPKLALLLI